MRSVIHSRTCRLAFMIVLQVILFLAELTFGEVTNANTLTADSFHRLSDTFPLIVGLIAIRVGHRKHEPAYLAFGWIRSEVIGGFVNSVFLLGLCFCIFVEAVEHLIKAEPLANPLYLVYFGVLSFVVSMTGLIFIGGRSYPQHSCGPSKHKGEPCPTIKAFSDQPAEEDTVLGAPRSSLIAADEALQTNSVSVPLGKQAKLRRAKLAAGLINMRALFLHMLCDLVGSLALIISGLVTHFAAGGWTRYVDPALSLMLAALMAVSAIPLLSESAHIVLQSVPRDIDVSVLEQVICEKNPEILQVRDVHVWWLVTGHTIATMHVVLPASAKQRYPRIYSSIARVFHEESILSVTVQPHFVDDALDDLSDH